MAERDYDSYFKEYQKKFKKLDIRILPQEYEIYKDAQKKGGYSSLRSFVRDTLLNKSKEILGKKNVEKRLKEDQKVNQKEET